MAKHLLKLAALALTTMISMGAYWASRTDGRLDRLEVALERLANIEAKVDILLHREGN